MTQLVPSAPATTSPFVPSSYFQFAWDSVSIGTAMSCWRKYQYSIIEGWGQAGPNYAIALNFGILFHKGLEFYHKQKATGSDHERSTFFAIAGLVNEPGYAALPAADDITEMKASIDEDADNDIEDDGITFRNSKVRTRYHLIRAVVWYLDHYNPDPATTYITAAGTAAVELSFRMELPLKGFSHPILLSGHIDRVVRFQNSLYVCDYKTTKSLSGQFFANFSLSHQLSGYTLAGKTILGEPVAGVLIDGIALQVGGCKFGRAPSTRSPGQITEYLSNVEYIIRQAEYHADRLLDDETYSYPMNTNSCYFCEFKQVCSQPPEYRRRYLAMSFAKGNPWNPLENR